MMPILEQPLLTATATHAASTGEPAILFPDGLVGCPDWKRFVLLVDEDEDLPVAVLRSLDNPDVELLVTDPTLVDPQYAARAGVDPTSAAVYCTLSIADDGWITANLLGPIVVDRRTREAHQVVLSDSGYTTRHPLARADGA